MYQTLNTVFDYISKHLEVLQKCSAARRIFNSLPGVWKCRQTTSRLECFIAGPKHKKKQMKARGSWLSAFETRSTSFWGLFKGNNTDLFSVTYLKCSHMHNCIRHLVLQHVRSWNAWKKKIEVVEEKDVVDKVIRTSTKYMNNSAVTLYNEW